MRQVSYSLGLPKTEMILQIVFFCITTWHNFFIFFNESTVELIFKKIRDNWNQIETCLVSRDISNIRKQTTANERQMDVLTKTVLKFFYLSPWSDQKQISNRESIGDEIRKRLEWSSSSNPIMHSSLR